MLILPSQLTGIIKKFFVTDIKISRRGVYRIKTSRLLNFLWREKL